MKAQIRKDLANEFEFSTNDGMQIDNEEIYIARYNSNDDFQLFINNEWHTIEGIDFELFD
ncbi:MAG: hypothetical protein V4547_16765 [Bacteroidota bacterium]